MQGPLENIIYVDGIILTEVTRPATSRASSNATYYALYFSQPNYWLPLEKTVCAGHLPGVGQVFQETAKLKNALKPLSELSFACFPDCSVLEPLIRIFIVFQDKATAEVASKLLPDDCGELSPGELPESGLEVLGPQELGEHLTKLQPLSRVPVLVSIVDKQIVLRIGSNSQGKYRKDFRWLLNTDAYYDSGCLDRINEVSLVLDPDCTYRPVTSGLPGDAGSREVDSVADMISAGILTMLDQCNTDLAITFAFHKGGSTHQLRSQLGLVNDLAVADSNEAHRDGRTDQYRPKSSKRYIPSTEPECSASNSTGRPKNKGKEDRYSAEEEDLDAEINTPEKSVSGSNNLELYLPEFLNFGNSDKDKDSGGDPGITDRQRRRQKRRGGKRAEGEKNNELRERSGRKPSVKNPRGKKRTDKTRDNKTVKSTGARTKAGNRRSAGQKHGRAKPLPKPPGTGPSDRITPEDTSLDSRDQHLRRTQGNSADGFHRASGLADTE